MRTPGAVNAQIAQRLFGWTARPSHGGQLWRDQWGTERLLPLYTADPHATALVWQWVEQARGLQDWDLAFSYQGGKVRCRITRLNGLEVLAHEGGTTWPEALCRAALALADLLDLSQRREGREMDHLDVLGETLMALAVCLHAHGPACVCAPCTALVASQGLLVRLETVLDILAAWSRGEAQEPILPEDLAYLLEVVLVYDHPAEQPPCRARGKL